MRLSKTTLAATSRQRVMASTRSTNYTQMSLLSKIGATRLYSSEKKGSLLDDDLLAKAGIDPSDLDGKAKAAGAGESADANAGKTTEEQRERWKGTARKSSDKTTTDIKREKHSNYFYIATLGFLVGGAVYLARDFDEEEQKAHKDINNGLSPSDSWARLNARIGDIFGYFNEPVFDELLPDPLPEPYGRPFTLVLGLDDVLIHSEWSRQHGWRTAKRPGLDYFLGYLAQYYEIVIFSSNYMVHSEKIVAKLDPYRSSISHALYREATRYKDGKVIKDLSKMNRDLGKVILIDCKPESYDMQPENAIPLKPWTGNPGRQGPGQAHSLFGVARDPAHQGRQTHS